MKTTKQELMSFLKDKKEIKEEKIQEVWNEKEAEVKQAGHTKPEDIELLTMKKVSLYFRKVTTQKDASEIKVIVLGLTQETDYGAKKQYDEAINMWNVNKNKAVLEGYTNEEGTPLWRNTGISSKKNKPIDWQKEVRRNMYCLARRDEDTTWKIGVMAISGDLLNTQIEIGKQYETTAIIGKATKVMWDNSRLIMYSTTGTEFKNPKQPEEPVRTMITKYAQDIIVPYADIEVRARQDNAMSDFFFVNTNIVSTSESMPNISNRVVFADPDDLLFDEDKQVTGWISEDIKLNVVDEAMDVYVLLNSRTFMKKQENGNEEEKLQVNVFGLFADTPYIKTEENTPKVGNTGQQTIAPSSQVIEETIDDSDEEEVKDW